MFFLIFNLLELACLFLKWLLLTTETQRQHLRHLREIGLDAHLVKPVAPADLVEALKLATTRKGEPALLLEPFDFAEPVDAAAERLDVLLVEDNPVNQELAVRLLEKQGCVVTIDPTSRNW